MADEELNDGSVSLSSGIIGATLVHGVEKWTAICRDCTYTSKVFDSFEDAYAALEDHRDAKHGW